MIELQVLGNDAIPLNVTETSTIPLEVTMSTGGGAVINNQDKSVTPTESVQSITADIGYTGLGTVTVGAISSDYVGSEVPRKSSADLTASGATVTAPSGYYESSASKSVASGTEGTPTASKGSVSNHSVAVTPSVTNTTGYIEGGTKTGTAVTVSASELVSGTKSVTANGTEDVTNYASVNVNVANSYSASDEGKVVNNGALVSQTSATYTTNNTYDTTLINSVTVNVSGGGSVATAVQFNDYVVPSAKWALQNSIPNMIANGGCFHLIYTLQANTSTSNDLQIAGFGVGGISSWSPNASTPCCYLIVAKETSNLRMYLRGGGGNTSIDLSDYADANDRLNLKFYQDHYVDVNTDTSYNYASSELQTWWNTLATKTYLSIGINQSSPLTGAVVEYWAFEEA